jgi:hypothetical protein
VSLLLAATFYRAKRSVMTVQPGILRSADYGNLSKLQKRDGDNASYADSPRRRL